MSDPTFDAIFAGMVKAAKSMSEADRGALADQMAKAAEAIRKGEDAPAAGTEPTAKADAAPPPPAAPPPAAPDAPVEKSNFDWGMDCSPPARRPAHR